MSIFTTEQRIPALEHSPLQPRRQKTKNAKKDLSTRRMIGYIGVVSLLIGMGIASIQIGFSWQANNAHDKKPVGVPAPPLPPPPIKLDARLDILKEKIEQASALKNLRAGVFVSDQATGRYVDMNGRDSFPAASMIKLPVFVALLNAVDAGKIKPDDMLEIKPEHVTGGSGWLQWRPVGTKISVKETADLMIIVSDNTATNMIIDLLGGKEVLTEKFAQWGLPSTCINNWLGDFEGTNTTSPYDLVYLLARVDRGEIINADSRKWMMQTMSRTRIRTLLPPGLGAGAKIAHKTGDIGCMVGDAGIVNLPDGGKYFVCVQVRRPNNDRRANLLIRSLSKMIYQCFSNPNELGAQVAIAPMESLGAPRASQHHRRRHKRG